MGRRAAGFAEAAAGLGGSLLPHRPPCHPQPLAGAPPGSTPSRCDGAVQAAAPPGSGSGSGSGRRRRRSRFLPGTRRSGAERLGAMAHQTGIHGKRGRRLPGIGRRFPGGALPDPPTPPRPPDPIPRGRAAPHRTRGDRAPSIAEPFGCRWLPAGCRCRWLRASFVCPPLGEGAATQQGSGTKPPSRWGNAVGRAGWLPCKAVTSKGAARGWGGGDWDGAAKSSWCREGWWHGGTASHLPAVPTSTPVLPLQRGRSGFEQRGGKQGKGVALKL